MPSEMNRLWLKCLYKGDRGDLPTPAGKYRGRWAQGHRTYPGFEVREEMCRGCFLKCGDGRDRPEGGDHRVKRRKSTVGRLLQESDCMDHRSPRANGRGESAETR